MRPHALEPCALSVHMACFNSLLEMPQAPWAGRFSTANRLVSILYWRCGGGWRYLCGAGLHESFNSLLEMHHRDQGALQGRTGVLFQFSIGDAQASSRPVCFTQSALVSILYWRCRSRRQELPGPRLYTIVSILYWRCSPAFLATVRAPVAMVVSILYWRCYCA